MKKIALILVCFLSSLTVCANMEMNSDLPQVFGVVRKIDLANNQITLKHETIPNLSMPGMTMPFYVVDPSLLNGLKVGDQVKFTADQNEEGDIFILSIEKTQPNVTTKDSILCTGQIDRSQKMNVEVNVRTNKFSTISYEYADGPYKGTAYINSIGRMNLVKVDNYHTYATGPGRLDAKLNYELSDDKIQNARFYHRSSGMNFHPVNCKFQ